MPPPDGCVQAVAELMQQCWSTPEERPEFQFLEKRLTSIADCLQNGGQTEDLTAVGTYTKQGTVDLEQHFELVPDSNDVAISNPYALGSLGTATNGDGLRVVGKSADFSNYSSRAQYASDLSDANYLDVLASTAFQTDKPLASEYLAVVGEQIQDMDLYIIDELGEFVLADQNNITSGVELFERVDGTEMFVPVRLQDLQSK